jgi:hypothetical protein
MLLYYPPYLISPLAYTLSARNARRKLLLEVGARHEQTL